MGGGEWTVGIFLGGSNLTEEGDRMDRDGHDICIESVRPDEIEALLELYIDLFFDREPLTKCMGLSKERMASIARSMYLGSDVNPISQGLCWVARDGNAGNQAVGFIVCDDPFAEGHAAVPDDLTDEELVHVSALQAFLEEVRGPLQEQGALQAGTFLHIAAIGVAPGYEGAGIATRLLQTALEGGETLGFLYAFAECTSVASKKCHEKNGFTTLHAVAGDSFVWNGTEPFAKRELEVFLVGKDLRRKDG